MLLLLGLEFQNNFFAIFFFKSPLVSLVLVGLLYPLNFPNFFNPKSFLILLVFTYAHFWVMLPQGFVPNYGSSFLVRIEPVTIFYIIKVLFVKTLCILGYHSAGSSEEFL